MIKNVFYWASVFMFVLVYGCAGVQVAPDKTNILYKKYETRALEFEETGEFRIALYCWKIAAGLTTDNKNIDLHISDLEKRIIRESEEHFIKGIDLYHNDRPVQALDEFLITIRRNPDHEEALRYLKYIQSGKKFAEIQKKPVTFKETFQKPPKCASDKAPEIVAFVEKPVKPVPESKKIIASNRLAAFEKSKTKKQTKTNLRKAQVCFNNKNYNDTIRLTSKILKNDTGNRKALSLKNASYFSKGASLQSHKKYFEALQMYRKVSPDYEDVDKKIFALKKEINQKAEFHYKNGVRLFVDEKIKSAIAQWKKCLDLNSKHAEARKSIKKACNILKKLKEVK